MRVEDSAPRSDDRVGRSDVVAGLSAVAVVGGATYLGLTTKANVAAILAFAAAVFVALLTAFWTQRRLDHELRAEQKRLELRLKHDRAQADLLDLRVVLEEALAAIDEAFHPMRVLWQNGVDETDDVDDAMRRVSAQLDRLHIRLGHDDPVVKAHTAMGNALFRMRRLTNERLDAEAHRAAPLDLGPLVNASLRGTTRCRRSLEILGEVALAGAVRRSRRQRPIVLSHPERRSPASADRGRLLSPKSVRGAGGTGRLAIPET